LAIVLSVILSFFFWPLFCLSFCPFSFGHCVFCHFVLFRLAIVLSVIFFFFFWSTTQWPKEKGQNDRKHNGQKKKDKMTDNTMTKRKRTK
jgi:preprotein translocase subunit SecY